MRWTTITFTASEARDAQATRAELQAELGLDPSRPVILFASKLQTRKHCEDLLEAYIESLSGKPGRRTRPYLVIVGDGEERARWRIRLQPAASADYDSAAFAISRSCRASSTSVPSSCCPRAMNPGD